MTRPPPSQASLDPPKEAPTGKKGEGVKMSEERGWRREEGGRR
jgi:hypothetical protein